MNSPKRLNYETRPLKFTERKMLLSTFLKICNIYKDNYQYIGLGGIAFTDFKLFHKELLINDMHSIEGGTFSAEKLNFNCPYSFIKISRGKTTNVLSQLDLTKKTLIWLDYDGVLDNYMFEDLTIVMNKLPIGSIYLMTCNRELKMSSGKPYSVAEATEKFGDLVPFDSQNSDYAGENDYKIIRKMLLNAIQSSIKERNRNFENIKFNQLYNILYQENRGARMFTFGGVITEFDKEIGDLNLENLPFVRVDESVFVIDPPNLTLREMELINNYISSELEHTELKAKNIVTEDEIAKYKSTYRFLPSFFDVRL